MLHLIQRRRLNMLRSELYKTIVETIISEHTVYVPNHEDVRLEIEANGIRSALSVLCDELTNPKLKQFVKVIIDVNAELSDDLESLNDFTTCKNQHSNPKQEREFMLFENNIIVLNCSKLLAFENSDNEKILKAAEYICNKDVDRQAFLSYLTTYTATAKEYYLIYKSSDFVNLSSVWQLYSYALFKHTCNHKIEINTGLVYDTSSNSLHTPPIFKSDVIYEQYFDVYDVLSEWHHSTDILTAFLKLYQILEYIIYRKRLVGIIAGANIKQSFVRQVVGIDKQYNTGERSVFIDEFKQMISFNTIIAADINMDIKKFCEKFFSPNGKDKYLSSINYSDIKSKNLAMSKFIYDVRCSIVHNKESEFHMTYANYEEYKALIPLMNKTMGIIREGIVAILNKPNCEIMFTSKHLPLY